MALSIWAHKHEDCDRARDPQVTGAALVRLAAHRDGAVKAAVAAREDCPLASMLSLAHDDDVRVLEALIANPSTPRSALEHLSVHKKARVRAGAQGALARHAP